MEGLGTSLEPLASSGVGCDGGTGQLPPPKKKSVVMPKKISLGALCHSFLTGRQHESLGTRILQSNCKITKLTNTVKKLSKNSRSDQRGAVTPSPPSPLNLPLLIATEK